MLQRFSIWITFDLLHHVPETHLGESAYFFIYENIKIFLLLVLLTHFAGLVRYYLPVQKMRTFLEKRRLFGMDYFFSSLFGAITPFCTCSSIPLFISFIDAGIPLGLTFAFLITSPLINEVAIVLFISAFGWKITALYITLGMLLGMIGGFLIGKMKMENEIAKDMKMGTCQCKRNDGRRVSPLLFASRDAWAITGRVMPYVLIGVGVGAAVHGYIPEGYFESILSGNNIWGVPLAVVIGIPLYANASAAIPIMSALVEKGVALGTAIAFMMAIVGLSLPEALILKRVMSWKLLGIFFGTVTAAIICIGYALNVLLP